MLSILFNIHGEHLKLGVMINLAHAGNSNWRRNYAVLFLVGITLIIWGVFILSFVFLFKGIF
jgi:heme/copper-type cytochrome/quinol oxidase subunit 2